MPRCHTFPAVLSIVVLTSGCAAGGAVAEPEDLAPALSAESITDGLTAHRPAVPGVHGLITAGHPLASMAGMRILMQGGTAADAAVAVLATLNQVEPMMSGAGGNGFMTIYDAETDRVYSLNATGAAPKGLVAAAITSDELNRGVKAGVVRRWCADAGRPTRFKPSSPSPTDAVRDGSAKLGHPVQNVTREHGLTPLPR